MNETKVTAKLRNLDIAPRKVRRVAELLRGLQVDSALAELSVNYSRGSKPLTKLIQSAVASAKEKKLNPDKLVISTIQVDQGRALKRLHPMGRGRASILQKKFSHIMLELTEKEGTLSRGYIIPKKVKKVKEAPRATRTAPKPEVEEKARTKEKKGFMQRVFRRKAV